MTNSSSEHREMRATYATDIFTMSMDALATVGRMYGASSLPYIARTGDGTNRPALGLPDGTELLISYSTGGRIDPGEYAFPRVAPNTGAIIAVNYSDDPMTEQDALEHADMAFFEDGLMVYIESHAYRITDGISPAAILAALVELIEMENDRS